MTPPATADMPINPSRRRKHQPAPPCPRCGSRDTFVIFTRIFISRPGRTRTCFCGECAKRFKESLGAA